MILDIDMVIYSYLYICSVLILYNLFNLYYSYGMKKKFNGKVREWQKEISSQIAILREGNSVELKHKKRMEKQLKNINQLFYYVHALDVIREQEDVKGYLKENYMVIQSLAYHYVKKESMERAFFAYFISRNTPQNGKENWPLMQILLSYLEDSTVYCRENVLRALYASGNAKAVENAFQIINDRQWFHHKKLLSDGLITFTGEKEELAERLWRHLKGWNNNLMVCVVQFITYTSEKFKERFLATLLSVDVDLEIRLAILRYFRYHVYEPVRPLLLSYLRGENKVDENMSVVAANVVEKYPGEETVASLKAVLNHSNWYLRHNATSALATLTLKVESNTLHDILEEEDRYASLAYVIGQ